MPSGKMAAQAGHAFLDTYLECAKQDSKRAQEYMSDPPGTKIVLAAENQHELLTILEKAKQKNLPCKLIIDSGHILPPHFDGNPIITAIGIGPARKDELVGITDKLQTAR